MNVLSLFDGISCARVALERAGIPVGRYYASEVDKFAISVSRYNYPDIIQLGDIQNIKSIKDDIDLMIGGFPCQDLSIAKKNREGLKGKRSGLFYEMVRLHKEVKPKWFIYENVASMSKDNQQIITDTLKKIDPDTYAIMINGALVSAQNRKRIFWTNIPNVGLPEDRGILLKDILEDEVDEKYKIITTQLNMSKQLGNSESDKGKAYTLRASNPNGVKLQRVGQIGKGGQGDRIYSPDGKSVNLSANGGGRGAKTGLYAVAQRGRNIVNGKRKDILGAKTKQRIEVGGTEKAHTITKVQKDSMVMKDTQIRKLTPIECERLTTLPDNYTAKGITEKGEVEISNTQRYKMCGNAFIPDVVAHIIKKLPIKRS